MDKLNKPRDLNALDDEYLMRDEGRKIDVDKIMQDFTFPRADGTVEVYNEFGTKMALKPGESIVDHLKVNALGYIEIYNEFGTQLTIRDQKYFQNAK